MSSSFVIHYTGILTVSKRMESNEREEKFEGKGKRRKQHRSRKRIICYAWLAANWTKIVVETRVVWVVKRRWRKYKLAKKLGPVRNKKEKLQLIAPLAKSRNLYLRTNATKRYSARIIFYSLPFSHSTTSYWKMQLEYVTSFWLEYRICSYVERYTEECTILCLQWRILTLRLPTFYMLHIYT